MAKTFAALGSAVDEVALIGAVNDRVLAAAARNGNKRCDLGAEFKATLDDLTRHAGPPGQRQATRRTRGPGLGQVPARQAGDPGQARGTRCRGGGVQYNGVAAARAVTTETPIG